MAKITVVIPNYNGMKYLPDCLDALYSQDADTPEYETIVVDNGSTDGSVEELKKRPQIRAILLKENTGFCHAVNLGIKESDSEYVILLNNDTKVKTGFIKCLYEAIRRDPRVFSASAQMLMWDREELIDDAGDRYCALGWAYARGKGKRASKYDKTKSIFASCAGAAIYRKTVFDEIGYFDEEHFAYLEDIDLGYRARIYGYKNIYAPKAKVVHFGSASTGSRYNIKKTGLAAANSVYIVYKNMPLLQLALNLPLLVLGYLVKFIFFCFKGMGKEYLAGIIQGIRKSAAKKGRNNKVCFKLCNLGNYIVIQFYLYVDIFRYFLKT